MKKTDTLIMLVYLFFIFVKIICVQATIVVQFTREKSYY